MRVRRYSMRGWSRNKTATLLVVGLVVLGLAGGGAYAALGGTVMQSASGTVDLQKGLVGHWKLDGNAKDATPNANDGILQNLPTPTSDRKGVANKAYIVDSTTRYVEFNNAKFPANKITISAWVNVSGLGNWHNIFQNQWTATNGSWSMLVDSNGRPSFNVYQSGSQYQSFCPNGTITAGSWYQIAGSYDGNTVKTYVNGILCPTVGTINSVALTHSGAAAYLGFAAGGSTMTVDDIRMYDRAVDITEAKALYEEYNAQLNAGSGQKGLVGHWKLDGNAKDSTPNGNNGTITGAASTADRKGRASGAYSFTNNTDRIALPAIAPLTTLTEFTFSAWAKVSTFSGQSTVIGSAGSVGPQLQISGAHSGAVWLNHQGTVVLCGGPAVVLDTWTHVAATYNSSTGACMVYVDGQSGSQSTSVKTLNYTNLFIGARSDNVETMKGLLDDVRIYNRVLSAAEIKAQAESYDATINLNSSPTTHTPGGNISQGLVGYWPFNNNAKDATPYANNGTVVGAALTVDRKGRANSAYAFNGTSNYIQLGNQTPFPVGSSPRTICAWGMTTDFGGTATRNLFYYGDIVNSNGTRLAQDGDNAIAGDGTGIDEIYTSIWDGGWHHSCLTYDGTYLVPYVDGAPMNFRPQSWATVLTSSRIGASPAGSNFWQGRIDELRVYNRSLSAAEIAEIYGSDN